MAIVDHTDAGDQRYNAGVGLYHFLYRAYSPSLGRWLHRDPAGFVDGLNLYEYVSGSPLNFVDPSGLLLDGFKRRAGRSTFGRHSRFAPAIALVIEHGNSRATSGMPHATAAVTAISISTRARVPWRIQLVRGHEIQFGFLETDACVTMG